MAELGSDLWIVPHMRSFYFLRNTQPRSLRAFFATSTSCVERTKKPPPAMRPTPGIPLPKADPAPPDQGRRHVAHGPRCPRLHASAVEGSGAKRPVAKGGPITPCEGRCRRCQQATRTRVAL